MRLFTNLVISLAVLFSLTCLANERQQELVIQYARFEQPLVFNVALPKSYFSKQDKRYVVLFDFHHYANTYLTGLHDWMSHNAEWPWLETIIVTPKAGTPWYKLFDIKSEKTALLDFLEQQFFPELDKTYRTNQFRIMTGFRQNASVALHTLIHKPALFNAYIALSPELAGDYSLLLAKTKVDIKITEHTFVLFAHGNTIKEDHQQASYQELNANLTKLLKAKQYQYKNYGQHYFMSMPALAVIAAIEHIFDDIHTGLAPESEISGQGVDAIVKHYKVLSQEKYGFEVSPKMSIERLGSYLIKQSPKQGIEVLKQYVALYPDYAYSHHALAKGYAEIGLLEQAISQQKQAVELSKSMFTWHQKRQQKYFEQLLSRSGS